jgi:nucleoid-associated protein YgaU
MAKNAKNADKNKNSDKQDAKKAKKNSQEEGIVLDAKNLLILGLIAVLLIAGIGFLIFGLVQSAQDQGNGDDAGQVETAENGGESDEDQGEAGEGEDEEGEESGDENGEETDGGEEGAESEGEDGEDSENGESSADSGDANGESEDENGNQTDSGEDAEVNAAELSGKYKQTSTRYTWGNDYECGDIKGESYKIVKGDTLWQIAEGRYCSGYAWVELFNANRSLIKNPDLIYPGWEIKMYKLNMI